jgi:hypothetical protein
MLIAPRRLAPAEVFFLVTKKLRESRKKPLRPKHAGLLFYQP